MQKNIIKFFSLITILLIFSTFASGLSRDVTFTLLQLEQVSRYDDDRMAYQQIQDNTTPEIDNSIASLLIIKDHKLYLFKDGYDPQNKVLEERLILTIENKMENDLWLNKMDEKPDYVKVTDRRVDVMTNYTQDFVTKNFGDFYIKVRDELLKKHVDTFKILINNRRESSLYIDRRPLPKGIYDSGPTKYFTSACAKTTDEKLYYAEDADGDGITETFYVTISDGFHWGYKSGPNIIFIYKNKLESIKNIIGKLANEAYFGTEDEEKNVLNNFPKTDEVTDMINDIYRFLDPNMKGKK